jgi:hypothetical protein
MGILSNTNSDEIDDLKVPHRRRFLWMIIPCSIAVFIVLCIILFVGSQIIQIDTQSGSIDISEMYLTSGLDSQGKPLPPVDRFPPDTPRIFCVVKVIAPKPVNVGIRWIYEDEIIHGTWAFYIAPLPGEQFREGDYRVEIFLIEETIEQANFSVGD